MPPRERRIETISEDSSGKRRSAILDMTYGVFILVGIAGTVFCAYQFTGFFNVWLIGLVYLMGLVAIVLMLRFLFKSSLHLTGWHEGIILLGFIGFAYFIMNEQNQSLFRTTFHTPFTLTPLGLVNTSVGQVALDLNMILLIFTIFAVIVVAYSARKLKIVEF